MAVAVFLLAGCGAPTIAPEVHLYAFRYGESQYPAKYIFADGGDELVPFAWSFWLIQEGDNNYLVDAGIQDEAMVKRWKLHDYVPPSVLLEEFGLPPDAIDALILTHLHADHVDGALALPPVKTCLQRREFEAIARAFENAEGKTVSKGYYRQHYDHLLGLQKAGLLTLFDGDAAVTPQIRVELAPYHTAGTQTVIVETSGKPFYLAPDNAYVDANVDLLRPIGTAFDRAGDLEYLKKLQRLKAGGNSVISGHEPSVYRDATLLQGRCMELTP